MSKKKYETLQDLINKCEEYIENTDFVAPASFRVHLGLNKQNVNSYKNTNPEYFDLIKTYERKILAKIEEYAIYGQAHPDIAKHFVVVVPKTTYYADKFDSKGKRIAEGSIKSQTNEVTVTGKFNQVGAMFILKSWERDFYGDNVPIEQTDKVTINIGTTKTEDNKLPFDIEAPPQATAGQLRLTNKKG